MTPQQKNALHEAGQEQKQCDFISTNWRTALIPTSGKFRREAAYDHLATGRRLRRLLERSAKKAARKGGVL